MCIVYSRLVEDVTADTTSPIFTGFLNRLVTATGTPTTPSKWFDHCRAH